MIEAETSWVVRATVGSGATEVARRLPPVVVSVSVPTGSSEVPPDTAEIVVTFSEPMMGSAWSVVEWAPGSSPDFVGDPLFMDGGSRLKLTVLLSAQRLYAFWLNTGEHMNFRDAAGSPLIPYLIGFQTGR